MGVAGSCVLFAWRIKACSWSWKSALKNRDTFKRQELLLSSMTDLDTIFRDDSIFRYPWSVSPAQMMHVYSPTRNNSEGKPYDFDRVVALLFSLRTDVEAWYCKETGKDKMDTYSLGNMADAVRAQFWNDDRFKEAFNLLGLNWEQDHTKATIPWWNEVAAGELDHRLYPEMHGVGLVFGPRHSLETQLMRGGVSRPIQNVSVAGIIVTAPKIGSSLGDVVLGLRGGAAYSNTYHVNAGALMATPEFRKGLQTVYDIFRQKELLPEFGITDKDVAAARLHSRVYDPVIDKGPMYVFVVETKLKKAELHERWEKNLDADKKEHDAPVYLPNTLEAVHDFIRANYRGIVADRKRGDDERYLLHPGALALASYSGMPIAELRTLFREGNW